MYRTVTEHSQTAEEVADIIKNVILSRAPHLRYQTNSQYAPGEVQAKFSDATGDKAIDLMEKRFYPETKQQSFKTKEFATEPDCISQSKGFGNNNHFFISLFLHLTWSYFFL